MGVKWRHTFQLNRRCSDASEDVAQLNVPASQELIRRQSVPIKELEMKHILSCEIWKVEVLVEDRAGPGALHRLGFQGLELEGVVLILEFEGHVWVLQRVVLLACPS